MYNTYEKKINDITKKYVLSEQRQTPQIVYNRLKNKKETYTAQDLRQLGTAAIAGVTIEQEVADKAVRDWENFVKGDIVARGNPFIGNRREWALTAHMPRVLQYRAAERTTCGDPKADYKSFKDYFASNVGLMKCARFYPKNKSLNKLANQVRKTFNLQSKTNDPYDDELVKKIKEFQKDNGLKVDGDYGIETHSLTQKVDIPDLDLDIPYDVLRKALVNARRKEVAFNVALSDLTNKKISWIEVQNNILPNLQRGIEKQFEIFDGLFSTYYDAADNLDVDPINPYAAFNPNTGATSKELAVFSWDQWQKIYDNKKNKNFRTNDPNLSPTEQSLLDLYFSKELKVYLSKEGDQIRPADPLRAYIRDVLRPQINQTLPYLQQLAPLAQGIADYQLKYQETKDAIAAKQAMAAWKAAIAKLIKLQKEAERYAKLQQFKAADAESMKNFYKQIPDLLWREASTQRPTYISGGGLPKNNKAMPAFTLPLGALDTEKQVLDLVRNYVKTANSQQLDFYENLKKSLKDKAVYKNYVISPEDRMQAINTLQNLYITVESLNKLSKLQEGNPITLKLPNRPPLKLTTTDDETGEKTNWVGFNLHTIANSLQIKYYIDWFARGLPGRISDYDNRKDTAIERAEVSVDYAALDKKAQTQADQMFELVQMSSTAGEEEFANREQIRQRAEEKAEQIRAQRSANAYAIQAQFNLRDEQISASVITTRTLETLNLILEAINVATNDIGNRSIKDINNVVSYIVTVFQSLDNKYYENTRISNELKDVDENLQNLFRVKLADIDSDLDQANDLAQEELDKQSNRDINQDIVTQLLTIFQESNVDKLNAAYPRGFPELDLNTSAVEQKLEQLEKSILELNRRLERNNDPFFVLWYEIQKDFIEIYKNTNNIELEDLLNVLEKIDELESLITDDNMQLNYDNHLDSMETLIDNVVSSKLREASRLWDEIRSTLVDAEGQPKNPNEYTYEDFEPYKYMWELWQTIKEMYDALDLEPSDLYNTVAEQIAFIVKNIPIDKMPFSGRSRDDFLDWYLKYGPQRLGLRSGGGDTVAWRRTLTDKIGLPLFDNEGKKLETEKQRKKFIRDTVIDSTPEEVRRMLFKRRKQHFETLTQFSKPGQAKKDPYIKEVGKAVFHDNPGLKRIEVVTLMTGFMLDNYLDSYINLAGEYMPQLKDPPGYGNEFDIRSDLLKDEEN